MSAAWLLAAPLTPFVLAATALVARPTWRARLAWIGVLPALVAAGTVAPETTVELPWILLGVDLALDGARRILLAAIALVWLVGGYSAATLVRSRAGTGAAWLLAAGGNLTVVVAADAVTLYLGFAVMTFAAVALIRHDRTEASERAARVYLTSAILGEAAVLSGLLVTIGAAGDASLLVIRAAMNDGAVPTLAIVLLLAGFAVKAGIVPLHVWLPLAHPAAPVPASAVLSGAMIKAGVVGWLALVPTGVGQRPVGWAVVVIGIVSVVGGALIGCTQHRPKVVLAYSSVSQMGFLAVVIGVGLVADTAALDDVEVALTSVAAVYVLHHGLAKAALFLAVGLRDRVPRWALLSGSTLAALALAGAPFTSGAVAKLGLKDLVAVLPDGSAGRVTGWLSLGAVGTTLIMARFLLLLRRTTATPQPLSAPDDPTTGPAAAWWATLVAVVSASWILPPVLLGRAGEATPVAGPGVFTASDLVAASWPVVVGVVLAAATVQLAARWDRGGAASASRPEGVKLGARAATGVRDAPTAPTFQVPPGDVLLVAETVSLGFRRLGRRTADVGAGVADRGRRAGSRLVQRLPLERGLDGLDDLGTRWRTAGVTFVTLLTLGGWWFGR